MYEELIVSVEDIGGGVVTAVMSEVTSQLQGEFCKLAEICKTEKLHAVCNCAFCESGNQKTGTLPHSITEVAISMKLLKLELYHMASLSLLFCKNRKTAKLEPPYHMASLELLFMWTSIFG